MHKPKEGREEQQKSEKPPHLPARGWESELRLIPSAPQPPGRAGRGVPEAIARPVALATPPERPASKAAPPCPPARGSPGEKRGDRAAGLRVQSVVGTQRGERAATPGRAGFKEPGDAQDGFGGEKPSQGRRRLSDVQIRAKMAPKCSHRPAWPRPHRGAWLCFPPRSVQSPLGPGCHSRKHAAGSFSPQEQPCTALRGTEPCSPHPRRNEGQRLLLGLVTHPGEAGTGA